MLAIVRFLPVKQALRLNDYESVEKAHFCSSQWLIRRRFV